MNFRVRHSVLARLRPRHFTRLVGVSVSVLIGAIAGCQGRSEPLSGPARILFDSLLAGNEAMFDSASANVGFGRLGCLETRARGVFGSEFVSQLGLEAEVTVRARHSRAEYEQGERGIEMLQPVADSAFCARIDSLWYARVVKPPSARRLP